MNNLFNEIDKLDLTSILTENENVVEETVIGSFDDPIITPEEATVEVITKEITDTMAIEGKDSLKDFSEEEVIGLTESIMDRLFIRHSDSLVEAVLVHLGLKESMEPVDVSNLDVEAEDKAAIDKVKGVVGSSKTMSFTQFKDARRAVADAKYDVIDTKEGYALTRNNQSEQPNIVQSWEKEEESFDNIVPLKDSEKLAEADGWIAGFNNKEVEITRDEADSLYSAKLVAIQKLKVPKSKVSLLWIEPAYNDDNIEDAPASGSQFESVDLEEQVSVNVDGEKVSVTTDDVSVNVNSDSVEGEEVDIMSDLPIDDVVVDEPADELDGEVPSSLEAPAKGERITDAQLIEEDRPKASLSISNGLTIDIMEIEHGVDDSVVYRYSNEPEKTFTAVINYDAESPSFTTEDGSTFELADFMKLESGFQVGNVPAKNDTGKKGRRIELAKIVNEDETVSYRVSYLREDDEEVYGWDIDAENDEAALALLGDFENADEVVDTLAGADFAETGIEGVSSMEYKDLSISLAAGEEGDFMVTVNQGENDPIILNGASKDDAISELIYWCITNLGVEDSETVLDNVEDTIEASKETSDEDSEKEDSEDKEVDVEVEVVEENNLSENANDDLWNRLIDGSTDEEAIYAVTGWFEEKGQEDASEWDADQLEQAIKSLDSADYAELNTFLQDNYGV